MPNCALCRKKLSVLDSGFPLNDNNPRIKLCVDCTNIIIEIKRLSKDVSHYLELRDQVTKLYNENTDPEVISYVDSLLDSFAQDYEEYVASGYNLEWKKEREKENLLKLSGMLITTGLDFQGYKITDYLGVIGGETVLGTGFLSELDASISDFLGRKSSLFAEKLESAKDSALAILKRNAAKKGANAIIGIDFDYIVFTANIIGVVANGTAVEVTPILEQ